MMHGSDTHVHAIITVNGASAIHPGIPFAFIFYEAYMLKITFFQSASLDFQKWLKSFHMLPLLYKCCYIWISILHEVITA